LVQRTKRGKIHQITTKYTKQPSNITKDSAIFLMTLKYVDMSYSKAHQNIPKLGFFCMKSYNLATLNIGHLTEGLFGAFRGGVLCVDAAHILHHCHIKIRYMYTQTGLYIIRLTILPFSLPTHVH
jgi:hypothetical protein